MERAWMTISLCLLGFLTLCFGKFVSADASLEKDEKQCPDSSAPYPCQDGVHCYSPLQRCDGRYHCTEGTDEQRCISKNVPYEAPQANISGYIIIFLIGGVAVVIVIICIKVAKQLYNRRVLALQAAGGDGAESETGPPGPQLADPPPDYFTVINMPKEDPPPYASVAHIKEGFLNVAFTMDETSMGELVTPADTGGNQATDLGELPHQVRDERTVNNQSVDNGGVIQQVMIGNAQIHLGICDNTEDSQVIVHSVGDIKGVESETVDFETSENGTQSIDDVTQTEQLNYPFTVDQEIDNSTQDSQVVEDIMPIHPEIGDQSKNVKTVEDTTVDHLSREDTIPDTAISLSVNEITRV